MWEQSNEMMFPKVTAGPGHVQESNLGFCLEHRGSPRACLACRLFSAGPRRVHELCPIVDARGPLVGCPQITQKSSLPFTPGRAEHRNLPGTPSTREVPGPCHILGNSLAFYLHHVWPLIVSGWRRRPRGQGAANQTLKR